MFIQIALYQQKNSEPYDFFYFDASQCSLEQIQQAQQGLILPLETTTKELP